jgi:hypothetical protein
MTEYQQMRGREPQSAFVDCDVVAYFPGPYSTSFGWASFSLWIVPGTVQE